MLMDLFARMFARKNRPGAWGHSAVLAGDGGLGGSPSLPMRYSGPTDWSEYLDEIPAWRLAQEAWAKAIGITLPDYRTRSEFEDAKRRCEEALARCVELFTAAPVEAESESIDDIPAIPSIPEIDRPPVVMLPRPVDQSPRILRPHDAAELFLADLVELGMTGPHDDASLNREYDAHCIRYNLQPCPQNFLRDAFKRLPSVSKHQERIKGAKRRRRWVYMIDATSSVEETRMVA